MERGKISSIYSKKDYLTGISLFVFFLSIYLCIFLLKYISGSIDSTCVSDECRYIEYSQNILRGFYSPPGPDINLISGPGYPLYLIPFQILGIERTGLIISNILLSSFIVGLLFFSSRLFIKYRISIIISSIWGFYYIHYHSIFSAHSEVLATFLFLSSFFCFSLFKISDKKTLLISSAFLFSFLVLTKVIFSYVLLFIFIISILTSFIRKRHISILVFSLTALIFTLPYQVYTYKLTGIPFYFSTQAGEQLYWMSTPHKGEFGEWQNNKFDANCNFIPDEVPCNKELYKKNHGKFYNQISSLSSLDRDKIMKKKAIINIKQYPLKYFRNISSNITRMFFNIPNSYFYQRDITTTARLIPNSILLTLILFSGLLTLKYFPLFPDSLKLYFIITLTYLLLSSLVSAYPRMLNISIPVILPWLGYTLSRWRDKKF